jgi:Flp pilus assembly protein TadD
MCALRAQGQGEPSQANDFAFYKWLSLRNIAELMIDSYENDAIARRSSSAASLAILIAGLMFATPLGGCKTGLPDMPTALSGMSAPVAIPKDQASLRRFSEDWGRRYDANRSDKNTALTYAKSLHALGQNTQAVAVLQGLAIQNPEDMQVLSAYGKALADAGQLKQAADILTRAHTPERPDWSVLSTQGSIADQLGDHEAARGYYDAALKIRPNDPNVLSNLGLSYALSRQLPKAEETLRLAASQPGADERVRQNLALVLGLQGKFAEADDLLRRDLTPEDAAANVATIREMIAQSDTWRDIQTSAAQTGKRAR